MDYNLKIGDIVAFKAEDDWLSKAIAWFTQTDVSHAAMVYTEDSIIEMGASGIAVHNIQISAGDSIYVMRLKSDPDAAPLIRSADVYLNAEVRYDFPALFILAGLLIYKRIVPTKRLLKLMNLILSSACSALDKMLNSFIYHGSAPAMICSQLVYQIYYDCGDEYRIQIENGCVFNSRISEEAPGSIRLIDLIDSEEYDPPHMVMSSPLVDIELTDAIMEDFYKTLCTSQRETMGSSFNSSAPLPEMDKTLELAVKFMKLLERLLEITGYEMPIESLFITPGDLVYHAVNLENEGMLRLQRLHGSKNKR